MSTTKNNLEIAAYTPNGRTILTDGELFFVQPRNDNYVITCESESKALRAYYTDSMGEVDYDAMAEDMTAGWDADSFAKTLELGVSQADIRDLKSMGEDLIAPVSERLMSLCAQAMFMPEVSE